MHQGAPVLLRPNMYVLMPALQVAAYLAEALQMIYKIKVVKHRHVNQTMVHLTSWAGVRANCCTSRGLRPYT